MINYSGIYYYWVCNNLSIWGDREKSLTASIISLRAVSTSSPSIFETSPYSVGLFWTFLFFETDIGTTKQQQSLYNYCCCVFFAPCYSRIYTGGYGDVVAHGPMLNIPRYFPPPVLGWMIAFVFKTARPTTDASRQAFFSPEPLNVIFQASSIIALLVKVNNTVLSSSSHLPSRRLRVPQRQQTLCHNNST